MEWANGVGGGIKKEELHRKGVYYPPCALKTCTKGRVPGRLMGKEMEWEEDGGKGQLCWKYLFGKHVFFKPDGILEINFVK